MGLLCRNAAGILVVYDMTERASFERAIRWLTELPSTMPADTVLILVGVNRLFAAAAVFNPWATCSHSIMMAHDASCGFCFAANKSDLAETREVTEEEGREAAEQHNCARYAETSAKTSDGIQGVQHPILMHDKVASWRCQQEVDVMHVFIQSRFTARCHSRWCTVHPVHGCSYARDLMNHACLIGCRQLVRV